MLTEKSVDLYEAKDNEFIPSYLKIRSSSISDQADCVFVVTGNGMAPLIKHDDYVMVAFTDELVPGEIGVFETDRGLAIRQYYKEGLRSFRPELEQYHIGSRSEYKIVGRCLGVLLPEDIRN